MTAPWTMNNMRAEAKSVSITTVPLRVPFGFISQVMLRNSISQEFFGCK